MQPRPRAETSKLLFPSLRFCICVSFGFSLPEVRSKRRGSGSLILPSSCLFLSLHEIVLVYLASGGYSKGKRHGANTVTKRRKNAAVAPDRLRELRAELARGIAFYIGSAEKR